MTDIHTESLQSAPPPLPPIPALPALRRGDAIEIQGPAASGKTHLLYHILVSVLVPVSHPAADQIAAVVYDTDLAFDIRRFRRLVLSRLSDLGARDPQESVRRVLARVHLFRPTSSAQLAASIANLSAYHSSHMPNQEVAFLAVDSMSTFYWADRFAAEQLRSIGPEPGVDAFSPRRAVLDAIQAVRRSHCPLVVLTNWALGSAPSRSEPSYRQHLRPFPVAENRIADLGAKASDHSLSPFRLAHHISLSFPPSGPLPTLPQDDALLHETRHEIGFIGDRLIHGLSRSSEAQDTVRFAFQITDSHVLFQPQESVKSII